ncbi:alpha/beta fold hydrolase [Limnobacter litoralis]|uniref:Alpha/beta hydrolase n=1 Tax=Limnobacter litoralis TaxID=481366 RepID=A0ABQ5YPT0_9BURK|nr:hypothetical protein [Limnobacter litoralis]GLR24928.1 hypothetical protein GCM10007875_00150 [Limnobacter litoralis]
MTTRAHDVIVFAHGWGYDPSFFNPLIEALQREHADWFNQCLVVALDQGYFSKSGEGALKVWEQSAWVPHPAETLHGLVMGHSDAHWAGVGHSLGFAHLLAYAIKWRKLVSVAGFTHFCSQGDLPGTAPRVLQRMVTQLKTDPAGVLTAFQQRAGYLPMHTPTLPSTLNAHHPLLQDLESMLTLNCADTLTKLLNQGVQVLAIEQPGDPIVEHTMAGRLHRLTVTNAPHSELARNPSRYTQALVDFLKQDAS